MTPMKRHAALGPIAWAEGGMRATTRDGFEVEIERDLDLWRVWFKFPWHVSGALWSGLLPAKSLVEARAVIAEVIVRERARPACERQTACWERADRASRPGPEGRTEDA